MDRMSATDAGFFFAEGENTPMHVGSVSVFEGPAPTYGDLVRLLLGKLPQVPRYRQRVRTVPLHLGRPLWVDDEHFQILYHVRHTAVPRPGSAEQLRNLAGRVLGQRLDMAKPLWEVWLVEGLADDRWAIISKVHHCMVDGVASTDLLQLIFDVDPDAPHPEPTGWTPEAGPSSVATLVGGVRELVEQPVRQLTGSLRHAAQDPADLLRRGRALGSLVPGLARRISTPTPRSLNGPIGPHRRWVWVDATLDEVKRVRRAHGGTVNDIVLAAVTTGFRDLVAARGELADDVVVRTMVPVSVRRPGEHGVLDNQISAVFVDLPVAEPDPLIRLASLRRQMDEHKRLMGVVDARSIIAMGEFVAPTLMAVGTRAAARTSQPFMQVTTTNVPGPRRPLYVLGRQMQALHAYVPINMGSRVSIGIYSYLGALTFGVNADFDAFPDVDVLADGIREGLATLADPTVSPVRRAT
ncbi:wax ester/triacylglycerol synthase family O-acyltransferase [Pseudonocardia sp. S2-4]|uniref:Diacylglycerol O-acyltransferase n=2 Tax=Pseudonocardia humida TaxID=2800819 RepID=A0ABT1A515_9PSEU|nr:wax ester/triacylglycerol synthase family O-acyltransferase [Pseudonocardia humida]